MHKPKNGSLLTLHNLIFIALWAGSYVAAWLLIDWVPFSSSGSRLAYEQRMAVGQIIFTLIPALLQSILIEKGLKRSSRGWLLYATAGALVSCIGFVYTDVFSSVFRFMRAGFAMTLPAALFQVLWLRHHIKRAWLWPLITGAGSTLMMLLIFYGNRSSDLLRPTAVFAFGLLQGTGLLTLWVYLSITEKSKNQIAAKNTSHTQTDTKRLEEPQETDSSWQHTHAEQAASKSR